MRAGLGLGVGALPASPSALLLSPRFDIQVEGGDGRVAFFVAARFGTYVLPRGGLFAPSIEAGARWHVSGKITVGLAVAGGIAVLFAPDGGSVFLVGATLEPFTWSFTPHHQVGLAVTALLQAGPPPSSGGPFFSVLLLPTAGYTYRF